MPTATKPRSSRNRAEARRCYVLDTSVLLSAPKAIFRFDQHEVVRSNGAWSESYHPGEMTLAGMEDGPRAEILACLAVKICTLSTTQQAVLT